MTSRHRSPAARVTAPEKEADAPQKGPAVAAGPGDYQSIVLTLDHLMARKDGHYIQKMVMSTQGCLASAVAILHYYRDSEMLMRPSTIGVFAEAATSPISVLVYTGPANVQVIMSVEAYKTLLFHPDWGAGSELAVSDKLCQFIKRIQDESMKRDGSMIPLFCITPTLEPRPATVNQD